MHPRASQHTPLLLRFNVHWTRASSRPPRVPRTELPPGMYLHAGRPDISDALQNVIAGVRTAYSTTGTQNDGSDLPSGIVIGSCGPAAIMDDAAQAISRVSWADWKEVGGVESVEECVFPFFFHPSYRHVCLRDIGQGIWVVKTHLYFYTLSVVAGQPHFRLLCADLDERKNIFVLFSLGHLLTNGLLLMGIFLTPVREHLGSYLVRMAHGRWLSKI